MNNVYHITFLILLCTIFISCKSQSKIIPFDSAKWKTSDAETKHQMANDLVKNETLTGKTKSEIIELLGKPNQETSSKDIKFYYRLDDGYFLGSKTFEYSLVVIFSQETEKVQSFGIID
jgi:hypothetical protein